MAMLWFPSERKTRRGTVFSPFWPPSTTALCSAAFDLAPLLRDSLAREDEADDEVEDFPSAFDTPQDAPIDDFDTVDDVRPTAPSLTRSPSPKRVRLEDIPLRPSHRHRKRRDKRNAKTQTKGQIPCLATVQAQVSAATALTAPLEFDASTLPSAHGGYAAKNETRKAKLGSKKPRTLAELLALGFRLVPWNGVDSRPIIDAKGRIIVVLAGQPHDPKYRNAAEAVFTTLVEEAASARFPPEISKHRRGPFPALNVGLAYSKGQRVPSRMGGGAYGALLQRLLGDPNIRRMAVYASAAFGLWVPKHDDALHRHLPHLGRNFEKSVFSCAAFNFGPNVWTFKHRDVLNVPFGWCAVQALGRFDPTKGGHLVLWDLKLVIEFPPGATILLPSATIAHSNIPVQAGDRRASFTQYTPGGLIRYIDNGFRTEGDLESEDPAEYERLRRQKETRWEMGIGLFSTVKELLEPV
ncbi:hypothetical protein DFH09DRAFT_1303296 [Mycena vulgaris]|nr:hypothetical protein DFH09DRAFT_1303296 [Mycena vulgaris]